MTVEALTDLDLLLLWQDWGICRHIILWKHTLGGGKLLMGKLEPESPMIITGSMKIIIIGEISEKKVSGLIII